MKPSLLALLSAFIGSTDCSLAADPNEKFYDLATQGTYENHRLRLDLYESDAIWVNGQRDRDEDDTETLKPGDVVEQLFSNAGHAGYFLQFSLDRLTPQRAYFTKKEYRAVRVRVASLWEYIPGPVQSVEKIELDLTQPNGLLIDPGQNHVELGTGITPKSKN